RDDAAATPARPAVRLTNWRRENARSQKCAWPTGRSPTSASQITRKSPSGLAIDTPSLLTPRSPRNLARRPGQRHRLNRARAWHRGHHLSTSLHSTHVPYNLIWTQVAVRPTKTPARGTTCCLESARLGRTGHSANGCEAERV